MRSFVLVTLGDGSSVELDAGDIIGRHSNCALHLDDIRISEAHAMVSLRAGALRLISLRGRFVDLDAGADTPLRELELEEGQRIAFARGVDITVTQVVQPAEVLGIVGEGLARQILPATASLILEPLPEIRPRFTAGAAAQIWSTGESWRLRIGDGPAQPLEGDDTFTIEGRTFRAVMCRLRSTSETAHDTMADAPLEIVARYDTVHLNRGNRCVLTLTGKSAQLVSELVTIGAPISWEALAGELWPDDPDRMVLRGRMDTNLARLRRKCREAGVRADLVHRDGCGHLELLLHPHDRVVDET